MRHQAIPGMQRASHTVLVGALVSECSGEQIDNSTTGRRAGSAACARGRPCARPFRARAWSTAPPSAGSCNTSHRDRDTTEQHGHEHAMSSRVRFSPGLARSKQQRSRTNHQRARMANSDSGVCSKKERDGLLRELAPRLVEVLRAGGELRARSRQPAAKTNRTKHTHLRDNEISPCHTQ